MAPPGSSSRSPLSLFAAGYDQGRNLLVFLLSDRTWTWDGRGWAAINGGIDVDESRGDPHLVYDSARQQLVYVGKHHTSTWDGNRWLSHVQPDFGSGSVAYDPLRKAVLVLREDGAACDRTACRATTWLWNGTSWTAPAVSHAPELPLTRSGAYPPPVAFDEARGVSMVFASAS